MTYTVADFSTEFARLNAEGWRIHGGPGLWWARCPEGDANVEAGTFLELTYNADVHTAEHTPSVP
jgi:hypothetical protein